MMTREQIAKIAEECGVGVSYAEKGNGGFVIDSSNMRYDSMNSFLMELIGVLENDRKMYSIDETVLFAA